MIEVGQTRVSKTTLRVLADEAAPYVLAHGGNKTLAKGVTELLASHLGNTAPDAQAVQADDAALTRSDYLAVLAIQHAAVELEGGRPVESLPLADGSLLAVSDGE